MNAFINRWIMRIKEARTVLVVAMWGIITEVQVLGFLRPYLASKPMVVLGVSMPILGLSFAYWYDKSQTMKGEQQERVKRREAFIGENMVLQQVGMAHMLASAFDKDVNDIIEPYREYIAEHKDGFTVEEFIHEY